MQAVPPLGVDAIRRHPEIDRENLYGKSLHELDRGESSAVFAKLSSSIGELLSGELKGKEATTATRLLDAASHLEADDGIYPSIVAFNRKFLNENGLIALLTLLVFDATKLDPMAIDIYRGGNVLTAAYGPRRTRQHKNLGKTLQAMLKEFPVVDEPATKEAAARYVEYRFLDQGNFTDYMRRTELAGNPRSDSYLRRWFRKFDQSVGFPAPRRGRPRQS